MIKFDKITKIYKINSRPIIALDGVSFEIKTGEFVSIVGRSGAGKTTLFKLLLAEEQPTAGQIFFAGENIFKIKPGRLFFLRRRIGAIFQDYKLFPSKTTYENVAYIMEVIGASREEIASTVPRVLEIVGLSERARNFPRELSGGERQRAAIARALIHRPEIILADEPTGNLDPYHARDIVRLLLKINEFGTTVVLATHCKEIIDNIQKRVITLENGKIIKDEEKGRFIL